jgi:hypothetical protein
LALPVVDNCATRADAVHYRHASLCSKTFKPGIVELSQHRDPASLVSMKANAQANHPSVSPSRSLLFHSLVLATSWTRHWLFDDINATIVAFSGFVER